MASGIRDRTWWTRNRTPILAGAVVGLVTGVLGIFATSNLHGSPIGGLVGAIGCGVTVGALSNGGVTEALVTALVADVMSSIAFFVLAAGGYLAFVWTTEGLSALSAISFLPIVLFFALGVAVPVGLVSLCLAGIAGAITTLVRHRWGDPNPTE